MSVFMLVVGREQANLFADLVSSLGGKSGSDEVHLHYSVEGCMPQHIGHIQQPSKIAAIVQKTIP